MTNYEEPDPLDPEGDTTTAFPAYYAAGAQIRQFGVGAVSTIGAAPSVLPALANPPEAMTAAAALAINKTTVTEQDLGRYFPSATYVADVSSGGGDGGTP
jgi:hypothetical protein